MASPTEPNRAEVPLRPERLLTRNQRQVLGLMAQGKTARDIAKEFEVSRNAVEGTQMRMRQRLGARTNVHLMVRCFELGIIAPPERPGLKKKQG